MTDRLWLRERLKSDEILIAPGVFEMISVRVADRHGFEALYMTGYGVVASYLGLPDAGIASYTQMLDRVAQIAGGTATPLIADGVMYVTAAWSVLYALDARTGAPLWKYDPQVPKSWGTYACCDVPNRGAALWDDKVFVATLDGYLAAIDAATGKEVWKVDTIDRKSPFTITGAPRVVKGKVIIGNGGAEYGVRGFVSAFDAETGKQLWQSSMPSTSRGGIVIANGTLYTSNGEGGLPTEPKSRYFVFAYSLDGR